MEWFLSRFDVINTVTTVEIQSTTPRAMTEPAPIDVPLSSRGGAGS